MSEEAKSPAEWFQFVQDLADKLTFKRILTILLAGILVTCTTLFYENRDTIFSAAYEKVTGEEKVPGVWAPGDQTKVELSDLMKRSPLIAAVVLTHVDLQKNRRKPLWWKIDDTEADTISEKTERSLPRPVFDYDPKNTQQMVAVLNNEFVCSRTADTVFRFNWPVERMPVVCRIAIPPFYGRMVGMLSVVLKKQPTKYELDQIRTEASRLAVDIYLRDVVKKPIPKE